jgi:REP element-mobilizing transposase RayT
MWYRLDRGSHSVYALYYHYVQVVKHRRKVFDNEEIINFLKEQIQEISKTFEVKVIDIGVDKDHSHMLFKAKPTLNIPRYINTIKTITSREIQRKFPQVKENYGKDTSGHRPTS